MGPWALGSSGPETRRPPFVFPSSGTLRKALREQKLLKANPSGLLTPAPGKGGVIPPGAKTLENHYNRPLPQKINKKSSRDQVHLPRSAVSIPRRAAEFQRRRKQSTELMAFSL